MPSYPYESDVSRRAARAWPHALSGLLVACAAGCSAPRTPDGFAPWPAGSMDPREPARVHYDDTGRDDTGGDDTEGGADEALVLVHGWASDTTAWRHQNPSLGDLARLITIDLPGHGESDPPPAYTMRVFADAIAAVLDDAGVRRAVLVGHSNGTPAVLNFYRHYPERTLALVGVDGALRNLVARAEADRMVAPFLGEDAKENLERMIDAMPSTRLTDEDREAIKTMATSASPEAIAGGFRAAVDPETWSDEPIDVPLLLILARQPAWDSDYEAYVRGRAARVDYRVWYDTGHYIQMERPDELRAALTEFLVTNELLGVTPDQAVRAAEPAPEPEAATP